MIAPMGAGRLSFEDWLQRDALRRARCELIDGVERPRATGGPRHAATQFDLAATLHNALRGTGVRVFVDDLPLRIVEAADAALLPDLMVSADARDLAAERYRQFPLLVAEVLSPESAAFDLGAKFALYRRVPTLREVLFIDPQLRRVDHFCRTPGGPWIVMEAPEGVLLRLPSIGASVPWQFLFDRPDGPGAGGPAGDSGGPGGPAARTGAHGPVTASGVAPAALAAMPAVGTAAPTLPATAPAGAPAVAELAPAIGPAARRPLPALASAERSLASRSAPPVTGSTLPPGPPTWTAGTLPPSVPASPMVPTGPAAPTVPTGPAMPPSSDPQWIDSLSAESPPGPPGSDPQDLQATRDPRAPSLESPLASGEIEVALPGYTVDELPLLTPLGAPLDLPDALASPSLEDTPWAATAWSHELDPALAPTPEATPRRGPAPGRHEADDVPIPDGPAFTASNDATPPAAVEPPAGRAPGTRLEQPDAPAAHPHGVVPGEPGEPGADPLERPVAPAPAAPTDEPLTVAERLARFPLSAMVPPARGPATADFAPRVPRRPVPVPAARPATPSPVAPGAASPAPSPAQEPARAQARELAQGLAQARAQAAAEAAARAHRSLGAAPTLSDSGAPATLPIPMTKPVVPPPSPSPGGPVEPADPPDPGIVGPFDAAGSRDLPLQWPADPTDTTGPLAGDAPPQPSRSADAAPLPDRAAGAAGAPAVWRAVRRTDRTTPAPFPTFTVAPGARPITLAPLRPQPGPPAGPTSGATE